MLGSINLLKLNIPTLLKIKDVLFMVELLSEEPESAVGIEYTDCNPAKG